MTIEICPLAADLGNLAEWAAVVVGFGAAAGTIWVATVANRTSQKAAEIANDAKAIAKQQHDHGVALQKANAEILGRLLLHEISSLPARLAALRAPIARAVKVDDPVVLIEDRDLLKRVLDDAAYDILTESRGVLERIHDLPDALGPDLATLLGHAGTLRNLAIRIDSRVIEKSRQYLEDVHRFSYIGQPDDFELLESHITFFKDLSVDYANRFRAFVGVPDEDYARFR